jgi:hypothetical protein
MTQFYLWYYPKAKQAVVKSIGLAHKFIVYRMKDDETEIQFKERAIFEFNKQYEEWLNEADPDYREAEILVTKILQ